MSGTTYRVEKDLLALAMTRSPVFMGVNLKLFFGNLVLCTLICLNLQTLYGMPLGFVFHIFMVRLSVNDPEFLFIFIKSLQITPPNFNYRYWGYLNSYEPW